MKISNRLLGGLALAWGAYKLAEAVVRQSRRFSWQDRVVIISGGSRGLGLVLARELVQHGAKVMIGARTAADIAAATNELQKISGHVGGMVCDVRDQEQVQQLAAATVRRWGRIDVLINVAGIMQVGPLDAMTVDDFREAMEINCFGALHTTLAVLPMMRRQQWGRIVNVASIGGKRAVPHMIPYDTSKFALVGLSTGLRTELSQDGILVTTVCPSLMRTGSPRNATFKGKNQEEYAWFSIGGSLPVAAISAEQAAKQILDACQHGDSEVYIGTALSPTVWASRLAPVLTSELLALVNRLLLPSMGGIGQQSAYGYESESALSKSVLTTLSQSAALQNNEMRPRASS